MGSGYWLGFSTEATKPWGARRAKKALDIQGCINHSDTQPREDEIIDNNGDDK